MPEISYCSAKLATFCRKVALRTPPQVQLNPPIAYPVSALFGVSALSHVALGHQFSNMLL